MPFSASQISPSTPKTLRSFSLHATSLVRLISFSLFLLCFVLSFGILVFLVKYLWTLLSFLTLSWTPTNLFLFRHIVHQHLCTVIFVRFQGGQYFVEQIIDEASLILRIFRLRRRSYQRWRHPETPPTSTTMRRRRSGSLPRRSVRRSSMTFSQRLWAAATLSSEKKDLKHWGISRLLPALKRQIHEPLVNSIFPIKTYQLDGRAPKVLGWGVPAP